jgi:F0F1-type ATP synthase assembly protein I
VKKPLMVMVGEYTSLAFLLPVSTFVGYGIGYLLDRAFGTHFLYIVFLLLGIVAGFIKLIQQIQKDTRNDGP